MSVTSWDWGHAICTCGNPYHFTKARLFRTGNVQIMLLFYVPYIEFYLQNVTSIEIHRQPPPHQNLYNIQINGRINQKDRILGITNDLFESNADRLYMWLLMHWKGFKYD